MSRLIRTDDVVFKATLGEHIREARSALKLLEEVSARVDVFKRDDFMDELRKAREYAEWAASFAVRDAVARVKAP